MPTTLFHDRFENRVAAKCQARAFGVKVTLKSGSDETASFTATFVDQEYEALNFDDHVYVKTVIRDFFLPSQSIDLGSGVVDPEIGMFINGADSGSWEILPLPGRPAVELQPGGYRWLCHTKEVTRESISSPVDPIPLTSLVAFSGVQTVAISNQSTVTITHDFGRPALWQFITSDGDTITNAPNTNNNTQLIINFGTPVTGTLLYL